MKPSSNRLAILIPSLVFGGAQRSMLKLAEGIAARGYPVDLVLSSVTGELVPEIPASVSLVDLKAPRVLASLPALVRYLSSARPFALLSVLHTNVLAVCARYFPGVRTRVIVSERNTLSSETGFYHSDLRLRWMPRLVKTFYPRADGVVAVSQGVADDLAQTVVIAPAKLHVIYNPIITPGFREQMAEVVNHPWLRKGEPPVILSVGRLTPQKDFPTLIRAFAQTCRTHPARLMILGDGEERTALEALVDELGLSERVEMPGFIANPYPYMKKASAFVLSSRWEGLPGTLIEALYAGIPLIATDCPSGPSEILAGGRHGKLVPVGDINALASAMELALDGGILPPAEESWYRFELQTVIDQYLQVLFGAAETLMVPAPDHERA